MADRPTQPAATPTLDDVRRALGAFTPRRFLPGDWMRKAAVAAVVRATPAGSAGAGAAEVLLIRRAEDPRDLWSGHMAFPGGRVDDGDADPHAAALRETREEVGLDLATHARALGRLSALPTAGRPFPLMVILPFVFELTGDPALTLNEEVAEVVWVPLAFLADRVNRSTMTWKIAGIPVPMPCYRWEGRVIWGLTLAMLDELVQLVTRST